MLRDEPRRRKNVRRQQLYLSFDSSSKALSLNEFNVIVSLPIKATQPTHQKEEAITNRIQPIGVNHFSLELERMVLQP